MKSPKRKGVSAADKNITFLTAATARPVRSGFTYSDFYYAFILKAQRLRFAIDKTFNL